MSFVPVWFMLAMPAIWLIVLPLAFLLVTLMLWAVNKIYRIGDFRELFRQCILKLWLVLFSGQILSGLFLFISQGYFGEWWYEYITGPVALNPLDNTYSMVFTFLGVVVCGVFVFFLDRGFAMKNTGLSDENKRRLAAGLALLTLPMLYFLPSRALYDPETPVYNFTAHTVWTVESACDVTPVAPVGVELAYDGEYAYVLAESLNWASPANATVTREPEFRLHFYDPELETGRETDAELWFLDNGALFRSGGQYYLADEFGSGRVRAVLAGTYVPPETVFDEAEAGPEG